MGIPVQDPNDPPGYAYNAHVGCCACGNNITSDPGNNTDKAATYSSAATTKTSNINVDGSSSKTTNNNDYAQYQTKTELPPQHFYQYQKVTKDLVGNSKEFRIENNKCDLRIIGNSNRIRIGCNHGNLQIIGNSTRLKIGNNNGHIRYTGNEGRISLGSESLQQTVDYIGNNGILKVFTATVESKSKPSKNVDASTNSKKNATSPNMASKVNTAATNQQHSSPKNLKVKSASYGGRQWQQFNELFQHDEWSHFVNASLPNLKSNESNKDCSARNDAGIPTNKSETTEKCSKSTSKACTINNSINIVNNYGNICIKNAVNVSI